MKIKILIPIYNDWQSVFNLLNEIPGRSCTTSPPDSSCPASIPPNITKSAPPPNAFATSPGHVHPPSEITRPPVFVYLCCDYATNLRLFARITATSYNHIT